MQKQKTLQQIVAPKPLDTQKLVREQVLSDQVAVLKRTNKALLRQIGSQQRISEILRESISAIPPPKRFYVISRKPKRAAEGIEYDAVLVLSDHHFPEVVSRRTVGGQNEFNPEICLDRLWDLGRRVIRITDNERRASRIDNLKILCAGDLSGGEIHEDLKATNAVPLLLSASQYASIVAQFVGSMTQHFEHVDMLWVPGNHGRLTPKITYKQFAENSVDMAIGDQAAVYLGDCVAKGLCAIELARSLETVAVIRDRTFLVGHGFGFRSWASIPVYGMTKDTAKERALRSYAKPLPQADEFKNKDDAVAWFRRELSKQFQHRIMGHWHVYQIHDNGGIMVNGALIGANEYSVSSSVKGSSTPVQLFFLVSREYLPGPIWPMDLSRPKGKHQFKYDPELWGSELGEIV